MTGTRFWGYTLVVRANRRGNSFLTGAALLTLIGMAGPSRGADDAAPADAVSRGCANEIGMFCHEAKDVAGCLRDHEDGLLAPCREALSPPKAAKDPASPSRRARPKRAPAKTVVFLDNGYQSDNARAFYASAQKGDAEAQRNFAACLQQGLGVQKDDQEAVSWFRRAAEQGDPKAQFDLGFIYETGRGVPVDNFVAYTWYFAYAGNCETCMNGLGPNFINAEPTTALLLRKLEATLTPSQISAAQALSAQFPHRKKPG